MTQNRASRLRSLTFLVPVISMLYFTVFVGALLLIGAPQFFVVLVAATAVAALALVIKPRIGYVVAAVVSFILLVLFAAAPAPRSVFDVFSEPANLGPFAFLATIYPLLSATLAYSILGVREPKAGAISVTGSKVKSRAILEVGIILLVVGFILGSLAVGIEAGAAQNRLIASGGTTGDITIVLGAASPSNGQFYSPATFNVKAGTTVTWINRDTTAHTVTSTTGLFDSSRIDPGASFKWTFTQPGTFQYYCAYHNWMKGTIVVTSG
jgi:plastocyanin